MLLMAHSLVDCDGYNEADFCRRLDEELLPKLDGTPVSGPGGYTSQSIRDARNDRVRDGRSWGDVAGRTDNTAALERVLPLATRASRDACNGGGQNMTRSMLTRVLVGASVGIDDIPERFINGLNRRVSSL